MEHINKIEILGRIGNIRKNSYNDQKVAHFSVVTYYRYYSKVGDGIETTWHNVVAWENDDIPDFDKLQKNSTVHITGRMKYSGYTSADGIERTVAEIVADTVEIVNE